MIEVDDPRPSIFERPARSVFGLVALAFVILLWPFVLFGRVLMTGDSWGEFFPLRTVAFREILAGRAPIWVDGMASGYPLFAMGQNAIAYPFTWIYMLDPVWGEQAYVLLPFLLCPLFTWLFARRLGMSPLAAAFAALSFTYGGFFASSMAHSGVMQNSGMWLPLMLLAVDASRRGRFVTCLLGGAAATALSFLGGHTQTFVFAAMMTLEYGVFLSLFDRRARWRPCAVAAGSLLLGTGACAFQIMETLAVIPFSVRSEMPRSLFLSGSFELWDVFLGFLAPTEVRNDVTTHLCAVALLAAGVGALSALRGGRRDVRVWFWILVAASGVLIMLGAHGPVYDWFSYVPVLRSLRQSARHAFAFTFALAMLAGYGWDVLEGRLAGRGGSDIACAVLLGLAVAGLAPWSMQLVWLPSLTGYLGWKAGVTLMLTGALACAMGLAASRARTALLVLLIGVAVVPEAAFMFEHCYYERIWTQRDPRQPTELTRWLANATRRDSRIYTLISPFYEGTAADPPNRSALFVRDVAGYDPLYLARYSNALSEVNRVERPFPEMHFEVEPLQARSHVLDLLNMRYVVLSMADTPALLDRWVVRGRALPADQIVVLSSLGFSSLVTQGAEVAQVSIVAADGTRYITRMRAGFQTAEWAYDRPDVKRVVRHLRARVYRTGPEGGHLYEGRFMLPDASAHGGVVAVEIRSKLKEWARLNIDRVLVEWRGTAEPMDLERRWIAITAPSWAPAAAAQKILVYENLRALPRAWLVAEVEQTTEEHALARIRGYGRPFDPKRTALLETESLPPLSGGGEVRLVNETPSRLTYEVSCAGDGVLVTSEQFYPGWEATVDGRPARVLCADYLLRAVAVPPGTHRVEMRYTAPGLRRGLWVTGATLLLALLLWGLDRRRATVR